jgi:sarcosine oxidase gamma subunit
MEEEFQPFGIDEFQASLSGTVEIAPEGCVLVAFLAADALPDGEAKLNEFFPKDRKGAAPGRFFRIVAPGGDKWFIVKGKRGNMLTDEMAGTVSEQVVDLAGAGPERNEHLAPEALTGGNVFL